MTAHQGPVEQDEVYPVPPFMPGDLVALLNDEGFPTDQQGCVIAVHEPGDYEQGAVEVRWLPFTSTEWPVDGEWTVAKVGPS